MHEMGSFSPPNNKCHAGYEQNPNTEQIQIEKRYAEPEFWSIKEGDNRGK
jgi:hypothetical protein